VKRTALLPVRDAVWRTPEVLAGTPFQEEYARIALVARFSE
jgi:hypothetical protein